MFGFIRSVNFFKSPGSWHEHKGSLKKSFGWIKSALAQKKTSAPLNMDYVFFSPLFYCSFPIFRHNFFIKSKKKCESGLGLKPPPPIMDLIHPNFFLNFPKPIYGLHFVYIDFFNPLYKKKGVLGGGPKFCHHKFLAVFGHFGHQNGLFFKKLEHLLRPSLKTRSHD